MASLRVHPDRLEIQLTPAEKALALRRGELSVPRSAIRSVTITDDPWIWIRGIRAPGALVPLVLAVGTWKFHGGKDFLVIKNKRQAVIIDIADGEYARLVVSTNHAAELVRALNVSSGDAEAQDADSVGAVLDTAVPSIAVPAIAVPAKPKAARTPRATKPAKATSPAKAAGSAKAASPAKPAKPAKEPKAPKVPRAATAAASDDSA